MTAQCAGGSSRVCAGRGPGRCMRLLRHDVSCSCRAVFSVSVFSTGTRWTVRTRRHAEPFVDEIYDAVLRDSAMCAGPAAHAGRGRHRAGPFRARRRRSRLPRRVRPGAGAARAARARAGVPVAVPLRVRFGAPRPVLATKNAVRLMRARSEPDTRADAEPKDWTISGRADGARWHEAMSNRCTHAAIQR